VGLVTRDNYVVGAGAPLIANTFYDLYQNVKSKKHADNLKGYFQEAVILDKPEE